MDEVQQFTVGRQPSCFSCDAEGGGMFRPHAEETDWYVGHWDGAGHYACANCKDLLFDAVLFGTSRSAAASGVQENGNG